MPIELTDQNFQKEVLNSDQLVLVDFWAPWCGPCKMIAPILEKLDKVYKDKEVKVAKLNVDENQQTAMKFQISGIPTMILFKDGQAQEQIVGVKPLNILTDIINKHLNENNN